MLCTMATLVAGIASKQAPLPKTNISNAKSAMLPYTSRTSRTVIKIIYTKSSCFKKSIKKSTLKEIRNAELRRHICREEDSLSRFIIAVLTYLLWTMYVNRVHNREGNSITPSPITRV